MRNRRRSVENKTPVRVAPPAGGAKHQTTTKGICRAIISCLLPFDNKQKRGILIMHYDEIGTAERTTENYTEDISDEQVSTMISKIIVESPEMALDLTAAPTVKCNLIYIARKVYRLGIARGLDMLDELLADSQQG